MRKLIVLLVAVTVAGAVLAAGDQAYLGIFAETTQTKMIGMQMPTLPPEVMKQMPPEALAMMSGAPMRKLNVRLWSPGIAPDDATATLAIPAGLKLGPELNLDIYRPKAEVAEGGEGGGEGGAPAQQQFTIKLYWGSSPTVRPGQPIIITTGTMTASERATIQAQAAKARAAARASAGGEYFYKPDWTTAYWPTKKQPGKILPGAALPGHYELTTNYTGNVAIDVPQNVDFLGGFEITNPQLNAYPPLDQAIAFQWKPMANLLGSHMRIFGMVGTNTLIMWSSSEIREGMDIDWDYMQMADVLKLVNSTVMMGPERTDCTVPAGIFQDCDMVNLQWLGYGRGTALETGQPLPRVQTKTSLMLMLGGKKAPKGMGGGMGGGNMGGGDQGGGDQGGDQGN
jgi:hypothetical protein